MKIKRLDFPSFQELVFWKITALLGITANIIPFSLITWAEKEINSGLASIYMAIIPIFSVLLAHLMTSDEKIPTKKLVGISISFIGVVVLLWDDVGGLSIGLLGQLACIVASVSYAFSRIFARRITNINTIVISAGVLACGILFMLPFVLFYNYSGAIYPSLNSILSIILLGIFPTAIAFIILYRLIHDVGAVFMTSVNYLVPLFALLWGFIILSEQIDNIMIVSLILIIIGVYFVTKNKC